MPVKNKRRDKRAVLQMSGIDEENERWLFFICNYNNAMNLHFAIDLVQWNDFLYKMGHHKMSLLLFKYIFEKRVYKR